jgi:hypothetical protein
MSRPSTIELYGQAGFQAGEVAASRPLRSAVCAGTATPEQLAEYSQYANKWNEYARLTAERDQADQLAASAPSPGRHDADPDGGLGAALRQHRDNQPPPKVVVRSRLIAVDMGEGSLQNIPEAQPLPQYRGSADATGHQRIAAGLAAASKKS